MKACEIVNSKFSWILKVDGVEVSFQGRENAEYFSKHYKLLGYQVTISEEN